MKKKKNSLFKHGLSQKNYLTQKCLNYDKSNLQQNSVKSPKDSNSEKMPKNNIKFQNVPIKGNKKREIVTLLTF